VFISLLPLVMLCVLAFIGLVAIVVVLCLIQRKAGKEMRAAMNMPRQSPP
jgi:hypothetical protein